MKKTLTVFAALMLVALAVPRSALAYDFSAVAPSGQTLYYNIVDGNAQVTSQNNDYPFYNSYPTGDLAIPSSVVNDGNTYSVTSIGNFAFSDCSGLTSVTIPNSVTSIGEWAFYGCSGLTSVTIPNSVTSIGYITFGGCSGLTSVTIPNSVTSIGNSAFNGCSGLTSVTIPNSVTSIGQEAFRNCSGLTSIVVDEGNTHYDSRDNCNAIIQTNLNLLVLGCNTTVIPTSVTSIGYGAFSGCSGLTSVTIPNSVTIIGEWAFYGCSGLTSVTIPNSVTSIGEGAFSGCSGLTSVTIPNSVTSIGDYAFEGCSGLTSVTIPNSVTSIGDYAFNSVRHIEYYGTATGAPWGAFSMNGVTEGDFIFSNAMHDTLIAYIGAGGDVVIPNSVTSIGYAAFAFCSGLTSVTIPNSVTSIGYAAFASCSGLTSVTIPNSVTSIGEWAFVECSGLTSVTIGESVNSIGYNAFSSTGFSGGDTIFILAEVPPAITSTTFQGVPTNVRILVPCGTLEDYQEADYWNNFTLISEDPSCYTLVTAVPNDAAYGSVSGGGRYSSGDIATLAAMPHNGYAFTGWADGNTDNPRLVLVSGDTTYTANFAPAVLAPIHDTTVVTVVDTVTLTEYVTVHDTVDNYIYDTTIVTDTLWLTLYDTVYITDTVIIHDTVYVPENGIDEVQTASIRLYQHNGQIVVEDADGGVLPEVVVYDAVGRKMETALAGGVPAYQFDVPASGVYLVKVGDRPARRIVVIR